MKKFSGFLMPLLALLLLAGCGGKGKQDGVIANLNTHVPDSDQYVLVETSKGNFKIKLYKDTPKHRANFVNLVMNGFYDGQLFFRIMKDFMIQAGDPHSKEAKAGELLGEGEVNYKIPAEPMPAKYYHKRGALSMASVNPMRESSGCQFYIITGKTVDESALKKQEDKINEGVRKLVYEDLQVPYKEKIAQLYNESQKDRSKKAQLDDMIHMFSDKADSVMKDRTFSYSDEQKKEYETVGGAAHLDGFYTVFGEVVEGMDVVEAISKLPIDVRNRPTEDVVIKKMTLVQ